MTQFDFLITRIGLFHVLSAFCGGNQKIPLHMPKNIMLRTLGIPILRRIFCWGKPEKILEGSGYVPQEQFNLQKIRLLAAPCILLEDLSHDTIGINAKVAYTYQSIASNFDKACSWEIETTKWFNGNSFISFSHEYIESKRIVNENYIQTMCSKVQLSFAFNLPYLGKGL